MTDTNILLFYVADPQASQRFYADLLGFEPVEASPTFVLFVLPSGLALGLWGRDGVEPAPAAKAGGSELGFKVPSAAALESTHADWQGKGATIALPPTDLDFGRSFVALDPDGHTCGSMSPRRICEGPRVSAMTVREAGPTSFFSPSTPAADRPRPAGHGRSPVPPPG